MIVCRWCRTALGHTTSSARRENAHYHPRLWHWNVHREECLSLFLHIPHSATAYAGSSDPRHVVNSFHLPIAAHYWGLLWFGNGSLVMANASYSLNGAITHVGDLLLILLFLWGLF